MNKFISLTKIQVKDFLSKYQSGANLKNNALGKFLLLFILVLLLLPSITFSTTTFNFFASIKQPELVITSMYVSSVFLMLFMAIPFVISTFFYAKDMKFLSSLPIREDLLVFSKLSTVYVYLLIISVLMIGPAIFIYGLNIGFNVTLIFFGLLALLLTPILPLLISSVLVLLVTRFISNSNNRNILAILGNLLLIVVIIVFQLGFNRFISNPEYLEKIFNNQDGLLALIGLRFPPSIWLTKMVLGSFFDTIYFIGINVLLVLFLQALAKVFYRRALLAFNQESSFIRGKIYYRKRSKGWQMIKRHLLIILKKPTFFLNTFLLLIFPVVLFVALALTGEVSLEILSSAQMSPFLILIFTGIISSPATFANISATAITREGSSFWELKALPVSVQDNLKYRVMTTLILNFFGSVLMLLIALFILPVTWEIVFLGSIFCITLTLFLATLDIIINIYRPLLNWTNPTAAVKNNLNIMISLGIRAGLGLLFYVLYKYTSLSNLSFNWIISLTSGLFLISYLLTRRALYTYFSKKFSQISV